VPAQQQRCRPGRNPWQESQDHRCGYCGADRALDGIDVSERRIGEPASFVPAPEIRALRDLTRTRLQLVKDRSREWQRLEKLLEGALVKLSSVVYPMARTKTARGILEAIAAGERDAKTLAALTHGNVTGGRAAVGRALEGMLPGDHHPALIRLHLDHIDLLDRLTAVAEDEIQAALAAIPAAGGPAPTASGLQTQERARPCCLRRSGPRRSRASASSSPGRSSPRRAWT
jgi:hypothetical protein